MKHFIILLSFFSLNFSAFAGPIVISGGGNPAAILCKKLGGLNKTVQVSNGQLGLCSFGEAQISAWTLFHAVKNGKNMQAVSTLLGNSAPDCEHFGGNIEIGILTGTNTEVSLCQFPDGSHIGLKTLQSGPQAPANQRLIEALNL
ncbi:MAG: hypothetical protein OM95_12275 [Bdellovibrio sp. ArHS]|uniref:DUF333 domain-containing protein n=1 Tax=Bdellovibrio sp. ArHS TaxID=1569284 RepID=UPI0005831F45|nr:DUF333 domain-containing protein [Bdellovibrio sp. ArHS]KHD87785.1 MAG: hypothetical protein OM95_12275 [Bdellovibrio sp. ArHS]